MVTIDLKIASGNKIYTPIVENNVEVHLEKRGAPGTLTFVCLNDGSAVFDLGSAVTLRINGVNMFYGFIFTKTSDKSNHVSVTAYNQLRYLKNKFTYVFEDKRADEILKMIADDYGLQTGVLANTEYMLPSYVCEGKTLFDIIETALDYTFDETGTEWVLYDDFGKMTLGNPGTMNYGLLINSETAEDFGYETTIEDMYNDIFLAKIDKNKNVVETVQKTDAENVRKYGLLRYYENVTDETKTLQTRADALLEIYNRVTKNLSIADAVGDPRVIPGSLVYCSLQLEDSVLILNKALKVNTVTHKFTNESHKMDLILEGGEFTA
ncbi:XkdQ/YqbQ family protein [Methanolapillus millepedarum]|uniref:YqbQ/XkdQ domain-containing protein n=1 Tax=Methanolapillus millepedarum TaxID=3028296 RepID=A0AA96V5E3_9EURY|nr:hypothetical protein MsAc7_17590 [Methanosarcinaceae archaeon Ac7]